MGADLYRAKYDFVLSSLTKDQMNFIDDMVYRSDDGTYELSADNFLELKQRKEELEKTYKTDLKRLFHAFKREINIGKGHFSFRVFV
jgi:hypothetical protein